MIATLTHQIEVPSAVKASALRDQCAAYLKNDSTTTVIASSMSQDTRTYTVYGVDTKSSKPFSKQVDAPSKEAAQAQVETKTMIVALVQ